MKQSETIYSDSLNIGPISKYKSIGRKYKIDGFEMRIIYKDSAKPWVFSKSYNNKIDNVFFQRMRSLKDGDQLSFIRITGKGPEGYFNLPDLEYTIGK